jgi:hypothetical protein
LELSKSTLKKSRDLDRMPANIFSVASTKVNTADDHWMVGEAWKFVVKLFKDKRKEERTRTREVEG